MSVFTFRVFLDGKWHADVVANPTADQSGYQYCLSNLTSGQSYDVNVQVNWVAPVNSIFVWRSEMFLPTILCIESADN